MSQTLTELRSASDDRMNIFKMQRTVALLGKRGSKLPEKLLKTSSTLENFKTNTDLLPFGMVGEDGWTFASEREEEELHGHGYPDAVRSDANKTVRSIAVTSLEGMRKNLIELRQGVDLSGVKMDPVTGEVSWDIPDIPLDYEYTLLVVGQDGPDDDCVIRGMGFHAVKLASSAEEVWGPEATTYPLELKVLAGPDGSPQREWLGGSRILRQAESLGFELASGSSATSGGSSSTK